MKHRIQLAVLSVISLLMASSDRVFSAQHSWVVGPLLYEDNFEGESLRNWIPELDKPEVSSVEVQDGKLNIDVGGGATVWFRHRLEGDILIEYEVTVIEDGGPNDRVSDLNQFWMASDPANTNLFTRTGTFTQYDNLRLYYVGMGGNNNSTTRFRRYPGGGERPLLGEHTDPDQLLRPNTRYHIEIICFKGRTQFRVNGELFHELLDPDPLKAGHFGFRTVRNHETIDNFKVHRLVESTPATPTNQQTTAEGLERRSGHPYLTYSDANIERLKERIDNEPAIADAWERMLADANLMVEPSAGERGGRRRGGGNELLCLAYRMTGDKRFGERVKESLFSHRFGGRSSSMLMKRNPPWHAGLDTGESCHSFALAYDTVYDLLTPEERQMLAARLAEEGIIPILNDWVLGERRIHALDTMGHNWWSAIVFGAGIGAMAIMDEDSRAAGWVQRVGAADAEWLSYAGSLLKNKPANFDRNGGFYESVSYAGYAIRSHLPFRLAWRDAFVTPLPEPPVLGRIADFFLHTSYFRSGGPPWSTDFGDSSLGANGGEVVPLLWSLGYRNPGILWYMQQCRGGRGNREGDADSGGLMRGSPSQLLYAPTAREIAAIPEVPDVARSMIFPDMGWATLRSSWEEDATLLGIKSGYTWNHAHADAGSFILFHQGKYLLIDSGKSGYSTPEYDDYYRQSVAHSVVMFNGRAENPEDTYFGSKFHGTVSHLLDAGDLRYVLADATGPTCDNFIRNFRSFLWVGDVILVLDDLKTFEPGQFEWLLHYDGEGKRSGKDFNITQDDVKVIVRPLFPMPFPDAGLPTDYPENMRLEERIGLKDHDQNTKMPYAAFLPTELMRRTKFITAIMPVQERDWEPPKIERLQTLDMIGLRITQHGEVTELWMNLLADGRVRHRNANLVYEGWETDAYLTVQTWPEGADRDDPDAASRVLVVDGSYLRRDGKVVLDSLSKVYLCATRGGDALDVQLQGQPVINAFLRAMKQPTEVNVNGQRVETAYDQNTQTLQLTIGMEPYYGE